MRGSPACPARNVPKELLLILSKELIWSVLFTVPVLVLSGAKFGWFKMLKYSARSWTLQRSVIKIFLASCMSQLTVCGKRRTFLPTSPKVPKMAGLLQLVAGGVHPLVTLVG